MKKIIQNKKLKEIPVFFASDDNYVPYLVVSIRSLIDTASVKHRYSVYVLNSGLNLENRKTLKEMETSNVKIKFVDVTSKIKDIYSKLQAQLRDYYSPSIFYRLFIPTLFPQYKKAVYLDCDITILDDIANLYNKDLKGNLLGAIVDEVVSNSDIFRYYTENALDVSGYKYFNSGIIVMNLEGFRKNNLEEKFLYLLNNYKFGSVAPDQDYLNVLCKDKIMYIDKGWDKMPIPDSDFNEKDLKLVHYNMFQKPWRYSDVLFEKYFWETAKKTKYYDMLLEMRNNYTEEKKQKDIEAGTKLLDYAKSIADDPENFKNTMAREYAEIAKRQHLIEEMNREKNILDDFFSFLTDDEEYNFKKAKA